jgi:hypothetical protein
MFSIHHIVIVGLPKNYPVRKLDIFQKLGPSPHENSRHKLTRNNATPTLQEDIIS